MNNIIQVNNQTGKKYEFNFEIEYFDDLYVYLDNEKLSPYIYSISIDNENGGSIELKDDIEGYEIKDLRLFRILDPERKSIYTGYYPILAKDVNLEYNTIYERLNELAYAYYENIKYSEKNKQTIFDKKKIRIGQVVLLNINNTNNNFVLADGGTITMTGNSQLEGILEDNGTDYIIPDFSDFNSPDGLTKAYIKITEE